VNTSASKLTPAAGAGTPAAAGTVDVDGPAVGPRLGLAVNAAPFGLLVLVNALVGGVLGSERTVLPLLAEREFQLSAYTAALTYIVAFGTTKAITNFFAGTLADRYGRKPVLIAGWVAAIPIPALLGYGPTWWWIVAANVLLGINQGLAWSTTVIMKIDLAGPARRGLAMGLNEAAGYLAVAGTAMATGALAAHHGLRPAPFALTAAYIGLGLALSVLFVRETHGHAHHEAAQRLRPTRAQAQVAPETGGRSPLGADLSTRQVLALTSWRDRSLSAASHTGMVNNLNDGLAWGLFPILFATAGLPLTRIGVLAALYPAVWGLGQLATGPASDRYGRKPFIVTGMLLQAGALALVAAAHTFTTWAIAAVLLGAGTAAVYPTLLAAISDVAHPTWRARAVGVYRLWRDGGFAVGALLAGLIADLAGIRTAIWVVAALTAASGLWAWTRMHETHPRQRRSDSSATPVSSTA
jgi:MFS family permease